MSNGLCRLLLAIWFAFATAICGLVFVPLALRAADRKLTKLVTNSIRALELC
jgi:hypothetical protein